MKRINISKTLQKDNGDYVEIRYDGTLKNSTIDLDKIKILVNNFLKNYSNNNVVEDVTAIRTIFRDCDEKSLTVFYQNESFSELVKYDDSSLIEYEKNSKNSPKCKFRYEKSSGISINYNNREFDSYDYSTVKKMNSEMLEMLNQVYYLNNIKEIVLDRDDKALIEVYKLFYNKNINFCSSDINVEVQSMFSILAGFGVSLSADSGFTLSEKMPISLNLEQRIRRLYPLGEVSAISAEIKLDGNFQKIIETVGKSINDFIVNKENKDEILINVSRTIYANRYCLQFDGNIENISRVAGITTNDVESSIKLVKSIKSKVDKPI